MPYSSLALQVAIFNALNSDASLQTILGGAGKIYDWVPENAAYPYVVVGDDTSVPYDSATFSGADVTITIHNWVQAQGRSKVKAIMDRIYTVLNNNKVTMVNQYCALMQFESSNGGEFDPDGVTYHGVQRFRAIIIGG